MNLVRDRRALVALVAALGLAFLASHVFSWTEPKAATAAGPGIRVRLLGEPKLFTIDGSIEPMAEVGRELRPPIEVRTQSNGLLLIDTTGPVVLDQDKLRLSWSGRATLRYDSNGTRRETSQIGALQVAKRGDKLLLILHLDFELYVTGVVAAEVGGRFPLEALKAQAVAARGYALSAQRRRRDRSWDVRASPADQAFVAPSDEPAVVRAVRATTGLYLSWQGLPLRSYYHSTCGGRTRDGRECFGDVPAAPFASQYCNACRTAPRFRWQRTLDHAGLRTLCATGNTVSLQPKTRSARGDWRTFGASDGRKVCASVSLLRQPDQVEDATRQETHVWRRGNDDRALHPQADAPRTAAEPVDRPRGADSQRRDHLRTRLRARRGTVPVRRGGARA